MRAHFNTDEFSALIELAAKALVKVNEKIAECQKRYDDAAANPVKFAWRHFWRPAPDNCNTLLALQIEVVMREDRRETIERVLQTVGFAISNYAASVTLEQREMQLLEMYGYGA